MKNLDRFRTYLAAYERKDLAAIGDMFTDGVHLRDWKISVRGKHAALAETAKNFEAARSIEIDTLSTQESVDTVAGELRILVDGEIELFVIDVVDFDESGHILAIRAYLGRSNH
ncbi:nuclear transport factor 2 family protein [Niveibacterium sp.]|uniref:nuclear transport factor 2 family protein n=1 Tax=Niveibacterium sp. TaxID=2017444 RepID=UPI0035B01D59